LPTVGHPSTTGRGLGREDRHTPQTATEPLGRAVTTTCDAFGRKLAVEQGRTLVSYGEPRAGCFNAGRLATMR
jgi:YD repeat-containing protein